MTQRAVSGGNTLAITYNYDNMPTGITKNGSSYIAYTYDGNGQRIRKQNLFTGSTVLYFGEVYEVRGTVGVINLFAGNTRVASIRSDGYEQYYHSDHLGSATVITDASGNQQETIQYFPFGTYRQQATNGSFPPANYTFTDQEYDDDTGLYNYKSRLYDPVLGRFLSADSIIPDPGNLQSYNRYSYCQNNPVIYTDPSGHFSLGGLLKSFITGLVAAAVFCVVGAAIVASGGTAAPGFFAAFSSLGSLTAGQMALAGAVAGAVGGGMGAALNGGNILQGALIGAAIGGASGGFVGSFPLAGISRTVAGIGLAVAGGGVAYAQGGLDGLANFGAGLAGAMVGAYSVSAIAKAMVSPANAQTAAQTAQAGTQPGEDSPFGRIPKLEEVKASLVVDQQGILEARTYTPLDLPGPETPFEIYHFDQEFLNQVQIQEQTDSVYSGQWKMLYNNYHFWDAIRDYYRFDVNEAIQHYRNSFMSQ